MASGLVTGLYALLIYWLTDQLNYLLTTKCCFLKRIFADHLSFVYYCSEIKLEGENNCKDGAVNRLCECMCMRANVCDIDLLH